MLSNLHCKFKIPNQIKKDFEWGTGKKDNNLALKRPEKPTLPPPESINKDQIDKGIGDTFNSFG